MYRINHFLPSITFGIVLLLFGACKNEPQKTTVAAAPPKDFLPSFNEGPTKSAILTFVKNAVDSTHADFVAPVDRIACFDNDGTLWCEQPFPAQAYYALDRIKNMAAQHPEWKKQQPFKAIINNDTAAIAKLKLGDIMKIISTAESIDNTDSFSVLVNKWMATAKHPHFQKHFNDLTYQPMLEVLELLRQNGFKTYIVSGGSTEFMRAWAPREYGIPVENIIGSNMKTKVVTKNGEPVVERIAELDFNDDREGKVISIDKIIGKKPVIVFGNSDGDLAMMEYAFAQPRKTLMAYVYHTDAAREYFYDEHTMYGRLEKGMEVAQKNKWLVIDMKNDWKTVFKVPQ